MPWSHVDEGDIPERSSSGFRPLTLVIVVVSNVNITVSLVRRSMHQMLVFVPACRVFILWVGRHVAYHDTSVETIFALCRKLNSNGTSMGTSRSQRPVRRKRPELKLGDTLAIDPKSATNWVRIFSRKRSRSISNICDTDNRSIAAKFRDDEGACIGYPCGTKPSRFRAINASTERLLYVEVSVVMENVGI